MAYDCDNQTCGKVQRFSTPDETIGDGQAIGDESNDNSRQLDLTWEEVARFMPSGGTGNASTTVTTEVPPTTEEGATTGIETPSTTEMVDSTSGSSFFLDKWNHAICVSMTTIMLVIGSLL